MFTTKQTRGNSDAKDGCVFEISPKIRSELCTCKKSMSLKADINLGDVTDSNASQTHFLGMLYKLIYFYLIFSLLSKSKVSQNAFIQLSSKCFERIVHLLQLV